MQRFDTTPLAGPTGLLLRFRRAQQWRLPAANYIRSFFTPVVSLED
jgi:hypothetical protein